MVPWRLSVQTRLEPFFMEVYDNTKDINGEIEQVAGILTEIADDTLSRL